MKYYAGIGSRRTPEGVLAQMTRVASVFRAAGYVLRSGGAEGADAAFERGVGEEKQVFLPWEGFNGNRSEFYQPTHEATEVARFFHPAWRNLSDGARKLHARNVHQVLGPDLCSPSDFVAYWCPQENEGGTGQALRIARAYSIPLLRVST